MNASFQSILQITFVACHYRGKLESYKKLRVESPTDVSAAAKACSRQQIKSALQGPKGLKAPSAVSPMASGLKAHAALGIGLYEN